MSAYCIDQNCIQGCCNFFQLCPTSTGSAENTNCYYFYYEDYSNYWWAYTILGVCILALFIGMLTFLVLRRRRMRKNIETITINQQYPSYANSTNNGVNNQNTMNYEKPRYQMGQNWA